MKTKDIPDAPILNYLAQHQQRLTMLFGIHFVPCGAEYHAAMAAPSIFPEGTNHKLALSKMKSLYRRGLVDGCPCGCRGDWRITDKGLSSIKT